MTIRYDDDSHVGGLAPSGGTGDYREGRHMLEQKSHLQDGHQEFEDEGNQLQQVMKDNVFFAGAPTLRQLFAGCSVGDGPSSYADHKNKN